MSDKERTTDVNAWLRGAAGRGTVKVAPPLAPEHSDMNDSIRRAAGRGAKPKEKTNAGNH